MESKIRTYTRDDATVTWDQVRCIHAAECVRGLPRVFDPDAKPWVQPENAPPDDLLAVIQRCPTGALHLRLADGTDPESTPVDNAVHIVPDGPLYVRGDVVVETPEGEVLLRDTRVALCRCGLSKHKPLCDNSHRGAFHAPSHLPDAEDASPEALAADAGRDLSVTPRPNGPLNVMGACTLHDDAGRTTTKVKMSLCRCGHSHNKPYCDGTHRAIGFEAP